MENWTRIIQKINCIKLGILIGPKIFCILVYGKLKSWSVSHFLIWCSKWLCDLLQMSSSQIRLCLTWSALGSAICSHLIIPFSVDNELFLKLVQNPGKSGKLANFRPTFDKFKPFEDSKVSSRRNSRVRKPS